MKNWGQWSNLPQYKSIGLNLGPDTKQKSLNRYTMNRESILIRVSQRNRTNKMDRLIDFLWGIGHSRMEAEKSYHLGSVSWRPKKGGGIIQSKVWEPWKQMYKSQVKDKRRWDEISQLISKARKKGPIPACSDFYSIQSLNTLDFSHLCWGGQTTLLSPPMQLLIFFRRHLYRHTQN